MKNEALLKKAQYKIKTGRFNEAINNYKKILRKHPNHFDALFMVGTLYAKQNKMAVAIRYLEMAVKIKPDFADLWNNLGNVYKATGDFARAKKCYMDCLKLNPSHASAHHGLGTIFVEDIKEQQRALECFRTALSLDPNIAEAHFGYGLLLINSGNPQGLEHLERAHQLNPHQEGLLNKLGTAYVKFGKTQEAIIRLKSAVEQNSDDTEAQYFLSIAQGKKPEKELREQYFEEMFDKFSGSFEQLLVEKLEYTIPTTAREILENIYGSNLRFNNMVDLGCGTGLSGVAFRDCTEKLTGIDFSEKMVREACQKNVYDKLLCGEVIHVLDSLESFYDFFLATDIFIYFQDLDNLIASIKRRSTPGALLVVTTECYDNNEDFIIRGSGRVAHSTKYIHRLTDTFSIKIVAEKRLPLRKEHEEWIEGDLYVCEIT